MYSGVFLQYLGNKDQLEELKNIVYLSYHFEPDLSAGSFRNSAVANAFAHKMKGRAEIHLFCTQPNRYKNATEVTRSLERKGNLIIHRMAVPQHGNGFLLQIWSFWHFQRAVKAEIKNLEVDYIYASSSKLFTAYLAYRIAKVRRLNYAIDLRDLFSENLRELITWPLFNRLISWLVKTFFEQPCLKNAYQIIINSEAFRDSIPKEYKGEVHFIPNGIDDEFLNWEQSEELPDQPKVICYAGNIGEGQGLHKIIPQLAEQLGEVYKFILIGDGSAKQKLVNELKRRNLKNVECLPPMKRKLVLEHYQNSHYLFLHLNDFKSFEKVLPSKVFEYAGGNIPILAGVAGYAKKFIDQEIRQSVFTFNPCDVNSVSTFLKNAHYQKCRRTEFVEKYARKNLNRNMADLMANAVHQLWQDGK